MLNQKNKMKKKLKKQKTTEKKEGWTETDTKEGIFALILIFISMNVVPSFSFLLIFIAIIYFGYKFIKS